MRTVTIKQAKAKLNELVEAAQHGEQVVLMRGSEHVAAIVPITEADLELSPRLTDDQAQRFWRQVDEERRAGGALRFQDAEQAVAALQRAGSRGRARAPRRPRARSKSRTR